jgi:hypothetical protein
MGLFDQFSQGLSGGLMDPSQAPMLGLAQGLLASSGASRLPVTLGAAMGNGIAGAQEAQGRAIQNRLSMYNLQRQQMMMGMLGSLMQPTQTGPSAMAAGAQQNPNQNVPAGQPMGQGPVSPISQGGDYNMGGVGPTQGNADAAAAIPQTGLEAALPQGMTPQQFGLTMFNPAIASMYAPTELMKNSAAAGSNPLIAATLKKNTLEALRPGGGIYDAGTGNVTTMPATAPPGTQNLMLKDGSWINVPIRGGLAGVAASEGARTGAAAENKVTMVTGAGGNTFPMFGGDIGGGPPGLRGLGAPGGPQPGTSPQGPPIPPGPVIPRGPTGQTTTAKSLQESSAEDFGKMIRGVPDTLRARTGLENALGILETVAPQTGPGAEQKFNALGYLNTAGIPIEKGDTTGFQSLHKYLANGLYAAASGSSGATGSDARFESFFAGQPNTEMNPAALKDAIRYVLSQQDSRLAQAQFMGARTQQYSGDPNAIQRAQTDWNNVYDPRYFEAHRQPVLTAASPDLQTGRYYNTPKGVMRRVQGGWEPVNGPQ